jgi:hypothetical protein
VTGIDTGDLFHDVFAREGFLFHPRFVSLGKRHPIKPHGRPRAGRDRPARNSPQTERTPVAFLEHAWGITRQARRAHNCRYFRSTAKYLLQNRR